MIFRVVDIVHLRRLQINCEQGVTLVELLIGISLLGLVFSLAYSIYNFGIVTFNRGEELIALQQEVRMVSRVLSEELRFAYNIGLLSSVPDEYPSTGNLIFVKDNKLIQVASGTENILVDSRDQGELSIKFKPIGTKRVDFEISLESESRSFSIDSSVVLMNIDSFPAGIPSSGNVFKYAIK